jgi:hypothetical protein
LLWRLEGLVDIPRADLNERVPLHEFVAYPQARSTLERELIGELETRWTRWTRRSNPQSLTSHAFGVLQRRGT